MAHRPLNHTTILRHVLDKAVLGGAVLDVDILDRALARRHTGMNIHKLYFTIEAAVPHRERIGASDIYWHPIPYRLGRLSEERGVLLSALRDTFTRIVATERPAFFVNHVPEQPTGVFLSRLARDAGLPQCAIFHGGNRTPAPAGEDHDRAIDLVAASLRATAGLSDIVAAVSDSAGALLPLTRVHNLGTGADAAFFDPARVAPGYLRARFNFPAPLPVFLLAARMVPEKGHQRMLDASQMLFDRRIDHRIVFAGSATPDIRRALEGYIRANGFADLATVIYDATQEEMVSIYRDADVVVLPGFHLEGCPRCLIEAGLMAKPVIATDAGGTREAFDPGNSGILVPVGDTVALADAMEALAADPARRSAFGQAGRRFACARFDVDALARRHEAAYLELLEPHGRRTRVAAGTAGD